MTDPTPDYILGWLACQEAAVQAVPNGWADQPHVSALEYGPLTAAKAISAIRALPPPGDLRAALEEMVKPLVWKVEDNRQCFHAGEYSIAYDGWSYVASWLNCRILATCPTLEAARAAAEADYRRRVVASIMGDEG